MNQSLDGYIDHMAFAPSLAFFRHFINEAEGQAGSIYGRRMHDFATHKEVPFEIFPEDAGLFVADAYGAELLRDAPEHRLSPPMRKSMTLNFSRIAAARLMHAEWAADRLGIPNPNEPSESETPEF